ncbi:zinc finger MYM-type protein 1 [Trichonephila clavipes]|nr:zinc finger MYM-type protein 1 [Trichonephila clavipes]
MQDLDDQQPSEKDIVQSETSVMPRPKSVLKMFVWLTRKEKKSVLDKQLQEQLRKDVDYYHNVFKWVISVVKSLPIRGLEIRGTEKVFGSPHNGNFMRTL